MDSAVKREFKNQLYEQFARIGKALSSGRRLELLELLAQGERNVEDLARETSLSVANCSRHLQVLRASCLVSVRRDGLYIHYRLADESILALWLALRQVGEEHLADVSKVVETYLKQRAAMEAISAAELRERMATGRVIVLDVRPSEEYDAGHIAGARSIPVAELTKRLDRLPKSRQIVAYCRGPYCVFADEAVAVLRARGYRALRLDGGFPEWRLQRFPIATGGLAAR